MRQHWNALAASSLLLLAACGSSDLNDKSLNDTILAVKKAPRVPAHTAEAEKAAGAQIVLEQIPDTREILSDRWFVGPEWLGNIPGLGQNSVDLSVRLNTIKHGQCLIRAGELLVDADKFCGVGSYMPNEGKWLAVGIAALNQNMSRDFLLQQLDQAELYARKVQTQAMLSHQ